MTKKERTIKAVKLLIEKYQWLLDNIFPEVEAENVDINNFAIIKKIKNKGKAEWFIKHDWSYNPIVHCPLCKIHLKNFVGNYLSNCRGCPEANIKGRDGCDTSGYYIRQKAEERLKYWKEYLPYLENLPEKYFTKKGWRYEMMKGRE